MSAVDIVGAVVCLGAVAAVIGAVIADHRAEKAQRVWEKRWDAWIAGGMKGPKP